MKALGVAAIAAVANLKSDLSVPTGSRTTWGPNDAPILIVMGQSNSYGHNTSLPVGEQITTPMTNVFTLTRASLYNLTFTDVVWSGMTTLGENNIATPAGSALGAQDHTVALSSEFARLWQAHIAGGNSMGLPNLYVIEAGWGSQGIGFNASNNRWAPERSSADVESLYPRITKTVRLAIANIKAQGKNPRIIAVHWNQWETDASATVGAPDASDNAQHNFSRIIEGFNDALGSQDAPWVFYYPLSTVFGSFGQSSGIDTRPEKVRKAVLRTVEADPIRRRLIDTRLAPHFTDVSPGFNIFGADAVHYSDVTQKWFASSEFALIVAGYKGVVCGRWPYGTQGLSELSGRAAGITQATVDATVAAASTQVAWKANTVSVQTLPLSTPLPALAFTRVGTDMTLGIVRDTGVSPNRKVLRPSCPSGGNKQGLMSFSKAPSDSLYGRVRIVARGRLPIAVAFRAKPNTVNSFQGLGFGYAALAFYDFGPLILNGSDAYQPNKVFFWSLPSSSAIGMMNSGGGSGNNPTGYTVDTTVWREWEFGLIADNGGTAYIQYRTEGTTAWTVIYSETTMDAKLTAAGLSSGGIGLVVGIGLGDTASAGRTVAQNWAETYGSLNLREFEFIAMD